MPTPTQAILDYLIPLNAQPTTQQTGLLAISPVLSDEPASSVLAALGVTVASDATAVVVDQVRRRITLDLGALFLEQFTTEDAQMSALRNLLTLMIERQATTICTAVDPVLV